MHVWITSTLVHVLSELLVLPAGFYTSTLSLKDNLCVQSFNSVSELSLKIKYLLLPLSITKIREASEPNRQNFQIEWGKCNTAHVSVATTWGCNFGNLPWFKFEIWNGRYPPKHLEWFINSISVFEIDLSFSLIWICIFTMHVIASFQTLSMEAIEEFGADPCLLNS